MRVCANFEVYAVTVQGRYGILTLSLLTKRVFGSIHWIFRRIFSGICPRRARTNTLDAVTDG